MKIASIIVLTTGFSAEHTKKCVEAIETNTTLPYELFVLRDDKESFGFSKDNNRLMRIAEGKYIVLMNHDCFVHPNWLEKMVEKAEEDPNIGLVGARLSGPDGKLQYEVEKAAPNGDVESIAFALVLIKRDVIAKIGYMNENYRFGSEDSEYCMKAWAAGFRSVISGATATHIRNSSMNASSIIMKSRGWYFFRRSHGAKIIDIVPQIGWDSTYPMRVYILRKAPTAFKRLRLVKVLIRYAGIWI
ncbi:MAG: glycosyltransferase [Nitrososphaerales archaeon]